MSIPVPPQADLSPEELKRYARHVVLPEVGLEGQRRLKSASVLVVGVGGLGSPASLYLAAAGVGRLGLVDGDVVDESNLQRQVLYATAEVGEPKALAAQRRLQALNPHIQIEAYPQRLTADNAWDLIQTYDIILDGTDNFAARYLLNDVAVLQNKPFVYGSISRFEGQVSVFYAAEGPCYRCIFPSPPAQRRSCAQTGVLGALPGVVGTLEATEALKLILGIGKPLIGKLLLYDALAMTFDVIRLRKNPQCKVCGEHPEITAIGPHYDEAACGQAEVPAEASATEDTISPQALAQRLASSHPPLVIDIRDPEEFQIGHLPGARNVPLEQLDTALKDLPREAEIVVVCRRGRRSADAVAKMKAAGFAHVRRLDGGLEAWKALVDPHFPLPG
ncbi:MAG: molybdopterin-synthase adenylyltransferase MoeB [Chloroflexi bacterium]|nr:molybdopterin-synthase adenylyltransferase MoeB [Chloroflexota bacterium]